MKSCTISPAGEFATKISKMWGLVKILFIIKSHTEHRKVVWITATFLFIPCFPGKTILQYWFDGSKSRKGKMIHLYAVLIKRQTIDSYKRGDTSGKQADPTFINTNHLRLGGRQSKLPGFALMSTNLTASAQGQPNSVCEAKGLSSSLLFSNTAKLWYSHIAMARPCVIQHTILPV